MKTARQTWILVLFFLAATVFQLLAQQSDDDHKHFVESKVKAENGDPRAQYYMGLHYTKGAGVEKNEMEAAKWYRKAAEQNDASAQCSLGYCYVLGAGVMQDCVEAYKWWLLAAERGDKQAKKELP